MALTNGANLGLLINGLPGEEHYDELMALWRGLDGLVMPVAINLQDSPPVSPADGDLYLIAAGAGSAWSGHDGEIARWTNKTDPAAWEFYTPKKGWVVRLKIGQAGVICEHTGTVWRRLDSVPTYADQAAAASGGLNPGEIFKTSIGALMVKT